MSDPRIEKRDRHDYGKYEGGDRSSDAAEALQRVHHEKTAQREGKLHPEGESQGLGDGKAAIRENVREPAPKTQCRAEEGKKADHRGDDPLAIAAEHDANRVAAYIGDLVDDELVA